MRFKYVEWHKKLRKHFPPNDGKHLNESANKYQFYFIKILLFNCVDPGK